MPVPQGRHGYLTVNGVDYPCYSVSVRSPRNLQIGMPVGNTWGTNYAEGLKTSRIVARMMLREKATELLASAFWNLFMSRTFSSGFDDTTAFTLIEATSKTVRTYSNVKAESFTISVAKGAPIGLTCVFIAPGVASNADQAPADYSKTFDTSPLLMFDKASFTGVTGGVYGFELTFSNNHLANGPLDGTKILSSWDAGVQTVGCRLTVPAHVAANEPFSDAGSIAMALAGGVTRTFTLTNVVSNTTKDDDVSPGQVFQSYDCIVLGDGTTTVKPLVIS